MIDLKKLHTLITLIESGSFSKAAEELCLSQPTLSRRIQALEEEMGVALVDRSREAVVPTMPGYRLIEQGRHLLRDAEQLQDEVLLLKGATGRRLRIAMGPLPAAIMGPGVLGRLKQQCPDVSVLVDIVSGIDAKRSSYNSEIEFLVASRALLSPEKRLAIDTLCVIPLGLLVAENHPLAERETLCMSDIMSFPIASPPFQRGQPHPTFPKVDLLCENVGVLLDITRQTSTICLASPMLANYGLTTLPSPSDTKMPPCTEIVVAREKDEPVSAIGEIALKLFRSWPVFRPVDTVCTT